MDTVDEIETPLQQAMKVVEEFERSTVSVDVENCKNASEFIKALWKNQSFDLLWELTKQIDGEELCKALNLDGKGDVWFAAYLYLLDLRYSVAVRKHLVVCYRLRDGGTSQLVRLVFDRIIYKNF
jgi:hypothetical protein